MSALVLAISLAAACDPSALVGERSVVVDGAKRAYFGRAPLEAKKGPAPLVFVWHGWGGKAENQLRLFGARFPDAYVIAGRGLPRRFPNLGDRSLPGWQLRQGEHADRDLKLFDALMKRVRESGCVDEDRVTSTGFSNGGFFTNLLGCARAEVFAGLAPVGGGGPFEDKCGRAVPVLVVHGTQDKIVKFARAERTLGRYNARAKCDKPAKLGASCQVSSGCARAVAACGFIGGHRFPKLMRDEVESFLRAQRRRPARKLTP